MPGAQGLVVRALVRWRMGWPSWRKGTGSSTWMPSRSVLPLTLVPI